MFTVDEHKTLMVHRAIVGLLDDHPNITVRARAKLGKIRAESPERSDLWDRWAALLDLPAERMADVVLADTPDGGLLRANSPLFEALSIGERNILWQLVGLMQFMDHYFEAADDLDLDRDEQAAITGLAADDLESWEQAGPGQMRRGQLESLKRIIALHTALVRTGAEQDARRMWLRRESPALDDTPLDMLMDGRAAEVLDSLTGAAQINLGPGDLPRMGNA